MSEQREQILLSRLLDAARLTWCHVPNGGRRDQRAARMMVASGAKAGVPDVLLFSPPPSLPACVGTALELKTQKGELSPEQRGWLEALGRLGWATVVAYGWEDAIEQLRGLGYAV